MKSHIHAGQSQDKMLHTHHETQQHNMGCKDREKEREKLREKILDPVILVQVPRKGRAEIFPWQLLLSCLSALTCPYPARKGTELGGWEGWESREKQGFCQRDEISMEGVSPPQAVTINGHQPGSTSPTGSGGIGGEG